MMVGILTEEQKDLLIGQKYNEDNYFNPVKDENDNWIISEYEVDNSNIEWVRNIPKIEFVPSTYKIIM